MYTCNILKSELLHTYFAKTLLNLEIIPFYPLKIWEQLFSRNTSEGLLFETLPLIWLSLYGRNLRSRTMRQWIYVPVQLTIKFNSTEFKLYSYTKFHVLILGTEILNLQMTSSKPKADLGIMSQLRWSSL